MKKSKLVLVDPGEDVVLGQSRAKVTASEGAE